MNEWIDKPIYICIHMWTYPLQHIFCKYLPFGNYHDRLPFQSAMFDSRRVKSIFPCSCWTDHHPKKSIQYAGVGWWDNLQESHRKAERPCHHWIGLRENLQETMQFLPSNIGFSSNFSFKPIQPYHFWGLGKPGKSALKAARQAHRAGKLLWPLGMSAGIIIDSLPGWPGWWWMVAINFVIFPEILAWEQSSQLTNSYIFQRGG